MKLLTLVSSALAVAVVAMPAVSLAQTQVITFDDACPPTQYCSVANGYDGMNWSQGFNAWTTAVPPQAYAVDGTPTVYVSEYTYLNFSSINGPFDLNSIFLSAVGPLPDQPQHDSLTISGYDNTQALVGSLTFVPSTDGMVEYDLGWQNVNAVSISSFSKVVLIDDISITATPEPGTLLMVGTGFIGLVGVVRRRRGGLPDVLAGVQRLRGAKSDGAALDLLA